MFAVHQTVALAQDSPDAGFRTGGLGAIVAMDGVDSVEVEVGLRFSTPFR